MPLVPGENSSDVFEDGENPPSSRSSESGFTEFVQYQADSADDIDKILTGGPGTASIPLIGSASSETASTVGSEETIVQSSSKMTQGTGSQGGKTTVQKTAMQCCLEYVQQFLTRFINLYIIPSNSLSRPLVAELQEDLARGKGDSAQCTKESKGDAAKGKKSSKKALQNEYLSAFIAACQLFLECSSFPVYIAEGNHTPEIHAEKTGIGEC